MKSFSRGLIDLYYFNLSAPKIFVLNSIIRLPAIALRRMPGYYLHAWLVFTLHPTSSRCSFVQWNSISNCWSIKKKKKKEGKKRKKKPNTNRKYNPRTVCIKCILIWFDNKTLSSIFVWSAINSIILCSRRLYRFLLKRWPCVDCWALLKNSDEFNLHKTK